MPSEKGKSFNWKAIFVQDDGEPPAAASAPPKIAPPPAVAVPPRAAPVIQPTVDEGMLKQILDGVISEAPKSYVELNVNIQTLADTLPTEALLYEAVVKLALKKGTSKQVILLDVEKVVKILEEHGRQFNEDAAQQVHDKVGAREEKVARLKQQIADAQAQLDGFTTQLADETAAISADTAKIESTKTKFSAAYAAAYNQLVDQKTKIMQYGKE